MRLNHLPGLAVMVTTPFFRIENDGPVPRAIFGETPSQNKTLPAAVPAT
jgi:hypothetical protein